MAANETHRRKIALLVDPRFPGGTSTAVAQEIRALNGHADLRVFALETAMFRGRNVNAAIQAALEECGIDLVWNPHTVRSEVVAIQNPSCLRFNESFGPRVSCSVAFVITQENFLRPNGSEGFDVAKTLRLIDGALVCGKQFLAPVSPHNRRSVQAWPQRNCGDWPVAEFDWFHICDFECTPPVATPRDRRGRHSRPGFEKFPPLDAMFMLFPPHAERCAILGGDTFLLDAEHLPTHWTVLRFGEADVAQFLEGIDFFVYFTHPLWRESFGRAIAEAIAAGKVVLTDPGTAEAFGDAVVGCDVTEVDTVIQGFIREPRRYQAFVRTAQASLQRFGPDAFRAHILANVDRCREAANALL